MRCRMGPNIFPRFFQNRKCLKINQEEEINQMKHVKQLLSRYSYWLLFSLLPRPAF